ncbi:MAG: hypothetical protein IH944_12175 [Armatimonadetes bacterium]|nr:hypothetical protein [Armatimonadota bacterium]
MAGFRGFTRRDFLQMAGTVPLASGVIEFLQDGSIVVQDHFIPVDKNLPKAWRDALFQRGVKEVWSGAELESIGMPCGGIAAGQMYVCGDGTLGHWEVFNEHKFLSYGATNYAKRSVGKPVYHIIGLRIYGEVPLRAWQLNKDGFDHITFNGQYPVATVNYETGDCPLQATSRVYSPFIPLNAKDSSLPVTIFDVTITNTSHADVRFKVGSNLENAVARSAEDNPGGRERHTKCIVRSDMSMAVNSADPATDEFEEDVTDPRPSILIEDFEAENYGGWIATGDSFGTGPARGTLANQNNVSGYVGEGLVNTFLQGDGTTGTLTSPEFTIERRYINFKIGGGNHPGEECMNLIVDGKVVRTATGLNDEELLWETWNVSEFNGKRAHFVIVDTATGGWGHINIDHIEQADTVRSREDVRKRRGDANHDHGTLALAILSSGDASGEGSYDFAKPHYSSVISNFIELKPGESETITIVVAWHFPNHQRGRQYANWFADAGEVVEYIIENYDRLSGDTKKWVDTYYDSSLPYWLLDRLHSTVGNLATGTTEWWGSGRFWAWEGVVCCAGTCTHVWNYEHALARLFPELERNIRERQDFDDGFDEETGLVGFRSNRAYAADGQCGTVLKAYREHLMSADDGFLKRNYPKIKKALQFMIGHDPDQDGLIEDSQHNTFDINFEGPNTFVGSLYLAALRAGEEMAKLTGDSDFAVQCRTIFESGREKSTERIWNGEYYFQDVDAEKHTRYQYGPGCISDMMFGQGWAHQVGLGYIYPKENVLSSLKAVWKYNWAPDVAPQNKLWKAERDFAVPSEAGLFICTWPNGGRPETPVRYRNEVWTGIEYQVAGNMIWEGMVEEGLAICRAVHDRYHPAKRNPYNEVECSDHYARALASWGVYLALLGFEYDGPAGRLAFDPRITPEDFKAAFTTAEGWGSFSQTINGNTQTNRIEIVWGELALKKLDLTSSVGGRASISVNGEKMDTVTRVIGQRVTIEFKDGLVLKPGDVLEVKLNPYD